MTDRICSVDGCVRSVRARGWCTLHYQRWRANGDVGIGRPARIANPRTTDGLCLVDGCDKPFFARGWCSAHYSRWTRHGDPNNAGVKANAPPGNKWCPHCKIYKLICEFYACRSAPSGCQAKCIMCTVEMKRLRRQNGKDRLAEQASSRRRRALERDAQSEPGRSGRPTHRKPIGRKYTWPHPRSLSIDHIVPISKGGDDVKANVQAVHLRCNMVKHDRPMNDQLRLIG